MNDLTINRIKKFFKTAFVATWIFGALVSLGMSKSLSAAEKRRWMPWTTIAVGVLFVFFSSTLTVLETRRWSSLAILLIVVPFVALISYLNIKLTKFCDNCDATQNHGRWFGSERFCSKCGAELDGKPSRDDRLLD